MELEYKDVFLRAKFSHEVYPSSKTGIPYLIGLCSEDNTTKEFTIKGEMLRPDIGEKYRLYGEFKFDKKYNKDAFHFYTFEIIVKNTRSGLSDYLCRYVDDLGKVRSQQIVDHFGAADCLKILRENPARIREIKGIGPATVKAIIEHFENGLCPVDPVAYASIYSLVSNTSASRKVVIDIINDYGASASDVIRKNPYILLNYSGIGWSTVDDIAVNKIEYDYNGIERNRGAILECLRRYASQQGDTLVEKVDLECTTSKELKVNYTKESLQSLINDNTVKEIVSGEKRKRKSYSLRSLWDIEKEIAYRLKLLIDSADRTPVKYDTTGLDKEQIDACKFISENPICLLIGPPGTGKTTTITKVIETLNSNGDQVVFACPTGKAAKRASEVLNQWIPGNNVQISTIHKALAPALFGAELGVPEEHAKFGRDRNRFSFTHNEDNPIPMTHGIVDESSMVDVNLLLDFLRAVPPGARLVFVGDQNQLPSVGPGACLRDMIDGGIPTFSLIKPRRNSGRIVHACHAVKDGRFPVPSRTLNLSKGENLFHIELSDMDEIAQEILDLHDSTDRDPVWDIQVISPQNDSLPIACENLNNLLSKKLNPKGYVSEFQSKYDKYRIGDKIVRTKNGFVELMVPSEIDPSSLEDEFDFDSFPDFSWKGNDYFINKTYVVNGDMGTVLDVNKFGSKYFVIVQFRNPDRLCRIPVSESNIAPAFAMTVHKAQGSGFPVVICPVHNSFYWNRYTESGLWHREMLFTILSRGIDVVITVGESSAIEAAVSRKTIDKRKTNLSQFIREELSHA